LAQEAADRKLALKFVEEEKKEAERVKRAKVEAEEVKKGILPAKQHVEDIISSHLEFLVGSDLGPFRSFCKKGNITLRVIKRPDLEERFRVKSKKMADRLGLEFATPVVAFHGTKKQNVDKIEKGGLKVKDFCDLIFEILIFLLDSRNWRGESAAWLCVWKWDLY
jgi:hypothetical protein